MNRKSQQSITSSQALLSHLSTAFVDAGLWFGHGATDATEEAAWAISVSCDIDIDELFDGVDHELVESSVNTALALGNERIATRKPMAYLTGEAWFAGLRFEVAEGVIVPRSHLGEWIPDRFAPWLDSTEVPRILDIGTGSGCIAIAMALAFPEARVVATDISQQALDIAARNVDRWQLGDRVTLEQCDLFPSRNESFELIITNPPYVDDATMSELPDEYRFEPDVAFRGGANGLDIVERIVDGVGARLTDDGHFIIEAGTARLAMEQRWPRATPLWLSTSSGEDGIALMRAEEVRQYFGQDAEQ